MKGTTMNALLDMIVSIHAYLWGAGIGLHPIYRKSVMDIAKTHGLWKAVMYIEIVNPIDWICKDAMEMVLSFVSGKYPQWWAMVERDRKVYVRAANVDFMWGHNPRTAPRYNAGEDGIRYQNMLDALATCKRNKCNGKECTNDDCECECHCEDEHYSDGDFYRDVGLTHR
jgi:hypothetical protein